MLTYSSAPLVQPLRLLGQAALRLTFANDQKDASFAVRSCASLRLVGSTLIWCMASIGAPFSPKLRGTLVGLADIARDRAVGKTG